MKTVSASQRTVYLLKSKSGKFYGEQGDDFHPRLVNFPVLAHAFLEMRQALFHKERGQCKKFNFEIIVSKR